MELWNEVIADKSWNALLILKKQIDFVLIGGWAVYLLTSSLKSKDIDIILPDFNSLDFFRQYSLNKNEKLRKYEVVIEEVSIDIYLPFYSRLGIPCEDLVKNTIKIQGINVLKPEYLLLLKEKASLERKASIKGVKDRTDILALLLSGTINFSKYGVLLKRYKLFNFKNELVKIIKSAKEEFEYLGISNLRQIKKIKTNLLQNLSKT